jgi:hypothetical protein
VARLMNRMAEPHPDIETLSGPLREQVILLQRTFDELAAEVMRFSLGYEDAITALNMPA